MPRPLFLWPGSKARIAEKIAKIINDIPHHTYVEPFCGTASVLMQKRPSVVEVVNDKNKRIVNLFRQLRENPMELKRILDLIPYSYDEFQKSKDVERAGFAETLNDAVYFIVGSRMGILGRGSRQYTFKRPKQGKRVPLYWSSASELVLPIANRLKCVTIDNIDALTCIEYYDSPATLFYIDPPYNVGARSYIGEDVFQEHEKLLDLAINLQGNVILSGYNNPLYNEILKDWRKVEIEASGGMFAKNKKRTEVLWIKLCQAYGPLFNTLCESCAGD